MTITPDNLMKAAFALSLTVLLTFEFRGAEVAAEGVRVGFGVLAIFSGGYLALRCIDILRGQR